MCIGLHVQYRHSCYVLIKIQFFRQIFGKTQILNFMKISRVRPKFVPCGPTPSILWCTYGLFNDTASTLHIVFQSSGYDIKPLNPELNPICYFLALLGAHHFLHVS